MSEPPFKSRWKPALSTRNNPKSALPSSRPSMFAANDHETVSLLRIEDRTTRAAIGQPSRTPSNTTSQIVRFGGVVVSSVVQGWCAVFIGGTALHTRSDPPISSKLIRILFWQKVPLPDSTRLRETQRLGFINASPEFELAIAVMVDCLAMLILYDIRKRDRYQHHFLAGGTILGGLAGSALSIREGTLDPYRQCIPMSITISLLLSVAAHSISRKLMTSSKLDSRERMRCLSAETTVYTDLANAYPRQRG